MDRRAKPDRFPIFDHRPAGDVVALHVVELGLEAGVALDGGVVLGALGILGEVLRGLVQLALPKEIWS